MLSKSWMESKTMWFNVIVFALGLAAYILKGVQAGEIPLDVSPEILSMLYGIVGIILRWITKQPVR